MSSKLHASLALIAVILHSPFSYARTYSVKKGDTLSEIAGRELGRSVYGSKGSLKKLLKINPEVQNPDRIYPLQIIRISDQEIAAQNAPDKISSTAPLVEATPVQSAPAATEPSEDSGNETKASFGVKLGLGVSKNELEAVDYQRSFKIIQDSELQPVVDLDVYYKPSAAARLGVSASLLNGEYADTKDGRFAGKTSQLHKLSLLAETTLFKRWHLGMEIGSEQHFFFAQRSATTFGLDKTFVDFATVSTGYDVIAGESWRWGLRVDGSYHTPADADGNKVEKGSSYGAATDLAYSISESYSLEASLRYGRQSQGMEGIRQKVIDREAEIALRLEF
jgi:hypothetical protein